MDDVEVGTGGLDMADITTAVTTALSTVQTNAMDLIGDVLPFALAIVGAVMVIVIGVKVFKRIANK